MLRERLTAKILFEILLNKSSGCLAIPALLCFERLRHTSKLSFQKIEHVFGPLERFGNAFIFKDITEFRHPLCPHIGTTAFKSVGCLSERLRVFISNCPANGFNAR